MKICLLYGFMMAVAGLVVMAVMSLLGYNTDVAHLGAGQSISNATSLAITITGIVLGVRACRARAPAGAPYPYVLAAGAGVGISFFSSLFGVGALILYFEVINPGFHDLIAQAQLDKFSAKGLDPDKAEHFVHLISSVPFLVAWTSVMSFIVGVVIALIVGAFLRRPAPPLTAESAVP
ncbi:MAG: DUF4199 domain-containing protein [Opitutaceae bacterium]